MLPRGFRRDLLSGRFGQRLPLGGLADKAVIVIEAIHTKIEGRARFKVEGLLGSDSFKRFLEQSLSLEKDIL